MLIDPALISPCTRTQQGERLVARERLPAPVTQTVRRLEINKRELGQTFKSDAKEITSILESMDVEKFNGKVTLKDGREI